MPARPVYRLKRCECTCAELLSACACGTSDCFLTLPTVAMDGDATPFADVSAATAALGARASGCLFEFPPSGGGAVRGSHSSSFSSGTLAYASSMSTTGPGSGDNVLCKLKFAAAATITVRGILSVSTVAGGPYSVVLGGLLLAADGLTVVASDGLSEPDLSLDRTITLAVPAAGEYYLSLSIGGGPTEELEEAASSTQSYAITANQVFSVCPVRAAYGGTPDYVVCTP